jgi:hypothetical protein
MLSLSSWNVFGKVTVNVKSVFEDLNVNLTGCTFYCKKEAFYMVSGKQMAPNRYAVSEG